MCRIGSDSCYIYILKNKKNKDCYVGSTTQPPNKRLLQHKTAYINHIKNAEKNKWYSVCDLFDSADSIHDIEIEVIKEIPKSSTKDRLNAEMDVITYVKNNSDTYRLLNKNNPIDETNYDIRLAYRNVYKTNTKVKQYIKINGEWRMMHLSPVPLTPEQVKKFGLE